MGDTPTPAPTYRDLFQVLHDFACEILVLSKIFPHLLHQLHQLQTLLRQNKALRKLRALTRNWANQ